MPIIPDELWDQYKDLEYYPAPICCGCECHGQIRVQKHHRYYGIPQYLVGHARKGKRYKGMSKEWDEKYRDLVYYPDHFCEFCGKRIKVNSNHCYSGIPRFCIGHGPDRSGENNGMTGKRHTFETTEKMKAGHARFFADEENAKRYHDQHSRPEKIEKMKATKAKWFADDENYKNFCFAMGDPARIEKIQLGKGFIHPGPSWYKTFKDFVDLACYLFQLRYSEARKVIFDILEEKDLSRFDLVIFVNFSIGHPMWEISEKYNVDVETIWESIRKIRAVWPLVFPRTVVDPRYPSFSFDLMVDEDKIVAKF